MVPHGPRNGDVSLALHMTCFSYVHIALLCISFSYVHIADVALHNLFFYFNISGYSHFRYRPHQKSILVMCLQVIPSEND